MRVAGVEGGGDSPAPIPVARREVGEVVGEVEVEGGGGRGGNSSRSAAATANPSSGSAAAQGPSTHWDRCCPGTGVAWSTGVTTTTTTTTTGSSSSSRCSGASIVLVVWVCNLATAPTDNNEQQPCRVQGAGCRVWAGEARDDKKEEAGCHAPLPPPSPPGQLQAARHTCLPACACRAGWGVICCMCIIYICILLAGCGQDGGGNE